MNAGSRLAVRRRVRGGCWRVIGVPATLRPCGGGQARQSNRQGCDEETHVCLFSIVSRFLAGKSLLQVNVASGSSAKANDYSTMIAAPMPVAANRPQGRLARPERDCRQSGIRYCLRWEKPRSASRRPRLPIAFGAMSAHCTALASGIWQCDGPARATCGCRARSARVLCKVRCGIGDLRSDCVPWRSDRV